MGRITGGEVAYGRTVKTGDFENKRVDVKLSFSLDDNESHEAVLGSAGVAAVAKAHEMLGMAPVVGAQSVAGAAGGKPVARRTASTTEKVEAKAAAGTGEVTKIGPLGAEDPVTGIPEGLKRVKPAEPEGDPLADVLGTPTPPAEVTDKDLVERVTRHNAKIKNPIAIRELVTKYGATNLVSLPQDKRSQFLTEMEALKEVGK